MQGATKDRQISIRIASEVDDWLTARAGGNQNKAEFIRRLLERERAREREQRLLAMFNEAAAELTPEDREERESLLGGFAGGPAAAWPAGIAFGAVAAPRGHR